MQSIDKLIDYVGECPNVGSVIEKSLVLDIVHPESTCWYFVDLDKRTMIIGNCHRTRKESHKKLFLVIMKKRPKVNLQYNGLIIYPITQFAIKENGCIDKSITFKKLEQAWENFYISETQDEIYYIIVN